MTSIFKPSVRFFLCLLICLYYGAVAASAESSALSLAKQIIHAIKKDDSNISFTEMIDQTVMKHSTLSHHGNNQPYFYTDSRSIISDIIAMVVENPDRAIDEIAQTGTIKIMRQFNFDRDIEPLMLKEKIFSESKFGPHLGSTPSGPTNQVMVVIKVNNFQDVKEKLGKEKLDTKNNLVFESAYPIILK